MGINGDYMSMAEAVGEYTPTGYAFIPGEDFDPSDPDECEAVRMVGERDMYARMARLERENRELRAQLRGDDDYPDDDGY